MDVDTFPDIQDFQHLPRTVIVKGGQTSLHPEHGAELRGIVINNMGQTIRNLRVHVVIFDDRKIPILNTSAVPEPQTLSQGAIGSFAFRLKDHLQEIKDYHLFTNWSFDDASE